ncbi:MAG: sulfotransferase family protein [Anaerolineales bacterium]
MLAFNFKDFFKFTWISFFKSKGTDFRLTPKRLGLLLLLYIVFPLYELLIWAGLLLDELFFPAYKEQVIHQPVFIVGNPRSGTTFLQRVLAQDHHNFLSMQMWEMLLAPSITLRQLGRLLGRLDRKLGGPFERRLTLWEKRWKEKNVMHEVALREPEEDEYLLLHIWSNLKVWMFAGMTAAAKPYTYFDQHMTEAKKERIMRFYHRCLQRHLHAHHANGRHYLSKNPSFSPMIDTLYRRFPDIKIIYLARNPLNMIPSYISLNDHQWRLLGNPVRPYGSREYVLEMAQHWYHYPLERLAEAPPKSYIVITYDELVRDVERVIERIYEHFDLEITPEYRQRLQQATARARGHRSRHKYSLEEMGLSREQLVQRYREIFERFGFNTREPESKSDAAVSPERQLGTR